MQSDITLLLGCYADCLHPASDNPSSAAHQPVTTVFGSTSATAVFAAAISGAFSAVRRLYLSPDSVDLSQPTIPRWQKSFADSKLVADLNNIYIRLHQGRLYESSLMAFSWSSLLQLRNQNTAEQPNQQQFDIVSHKSYALSCDALTFLANLSEQQLQVSNDLSSLVYGVLLDDVSSFLTCFPPSNIALQQAEQIAQIMKTLLLRCGDRKRLAYSTHLWKKEANSEQTNSVDVVLGMCSALFPLAFRPLVEFLAATIGDKRTAAFAANHLENRLCTVTEASAGYSETLVAVDEDSNAIWESLQAEYGDDARRAASMLSMCYADGSNYLFVQASTDIPASQYRQSFPQGSIGISNDTLAVVSWVAPWNGFRAVFHILGASLDLLRGGEQSQSYSESVVDELLSSTLAALKLLSRLCSCGSAVLKTHIDELSASHKTRLVTFVSSFVSALSSGKYASRCVSPFWAESLLSASLECLLGVVGDSGERASHALGALDYAESDYLSTMDSAESRSLINAAIATLSHISSRYSENLAGVTLLGGQDPGGDISMQQSSAKMVQDEPFRERNVLGNVLMRSRIIPWWLASPKENQSDNLYEWLVPACILRHYVTFPDMLYSDSRLSSIIASVILTAAKSKQTLSSHCFLFPALASALAVCDEFLSMRRILLVKGTHQDDRRSSELLKPSALEMVMMRKEIQEAFALLASGSAMCLTDPRFFNSWMSSEQRPLVSSILDDVRPEYETGSVVSHYFFAQSWGMLLSDTSAKCLSGLYNCLWHCPVEGEVLQAPWPRLDVSFNAQEEGGLPIRRHITKRIIYDKSAAVLRLLSSVVTYGQRAVSRALLGPVGSVKSHDTPTAAATGEGAQGAKVVTTTPADLDVLASVLNCLKQSFKYYLHVEDEESGAVTSCSRKLTRASVVMAECVRFLRASWDSSNSKWFRESFIRLDAWQVLGSLMPCGNSRSSNSANFDLRRAVQNCYAKDGIGGRAGADCCLSTNCLERTFLWRRIACDTLHIFSSEILNTATQELVRERNNQSESNGNGVKLSEKLFREQLFREFASVFSERWMYCLLLPVGFKVLGNSDQMVIEHATTNAVEREGKVSSIEQSAEDLGAQVASLLGFSNNSMKFVQLTNRQRDEDGRQSALHEIDMKQLRRLFRSRGIDPTEGDSYLDRVKYSNIALAGQDVYVDVASSFTSMAGAVLFVDSFSPDRSLDLTYSSPQFGGKLCRFLSHMMIHITPYVSDSSNAIAVTGGFSRLMCSLAAQMSKYELEQPALTAVKISPCPSNLAKQCSQTPVGQICSFLLNLTSQPRFAIRKEPWFSETCDIVRWLLLTAATLVTGSSFADRADHRTLADSCFVVLKRAGGIPEVCAGVSVALSAALEQGIDDERLALLNPQSVHVLFSAINSLSSLSQRKNSAADSCATLFLTIARIYRALSPGQQSKLLILRYLNVGAIQAFLPLEGKLIPSYSRELDKRNPVHLVWCCALQLASLVIPTRLEENRNGDEKDQLHRDIVEFSSTHLMRIIRDSLDLSGDWSGPWGTELDASMSSGASGGLPSVKQTTIARAEESEVAAGLLYKLSNFSLMLTGELPDLTHAAIKQMCRYIHQCLMILRTEPTERCVRPVTQRESERSSLGNGAHVDGEQPAQPGTPRWSSSPPRASFVAPGTPKLRRSPSRAVRDAVSGPLASPSFATPATPQSPLVSFRRANGSSPSLAIGSPWAQLGPGLILSEGQSFAEEVWNCLLRGMCAALNALSQYCMKLETLPFAATLDSTEESPGLGILVRIQKFALSYLQRGANENIRDYLMMIADASMHLLIYHVVRYNETDTIPQGAKDELRKRMVTHMSRMTRILPPPPPTSLFSNDAIRTFWKAF